MSSEEGKFKHTEAGLIPEEWRISTLSELALKITKGTTPTTIGGRFTDNGINFVKVECLNDDGTISKEKFMYVDEETNELLSRSELQINDLLYSIAGTIGRVSIVTGDILPANTNQAVAIIRPNLGKINLYYLRYALVNPKLKNYLLSKVVHAVQANLSLTEIGNCPIPIPKPKEQQSIAKILSDLDAKIAVNVKMNRALEAVGQTVFKRWFVDFDFPNEEGKPYKSSGGEFATSELGMIPKDWCVEKISDVLELAYGKALKETNRNPSKTPVYGSNGPIGWHDERLVEGPGIIVGRKGNPGTVTWSNTDFFPIDTTFYVVPKGSAKSLYYLFYLLKEQNLASLIVD